MRIKTMPVTAINPHGTCDDCAWHTVNEESDLSGSVFKWFCWRNSGAPDTRFVTIDPFAPPACECHLKSKADNADV